MDTSTLKELGYTEAQAKVYLALLEAGETTSGPIIKKTNLQNSVVYNALNQLIQEGLASFVIKGKTKYFSATNPKQLMKILENKKEKLKEILPELISKHKPIEKQEAKVFSGWKGVYTAFYTILETLPKGSEYIGFAAGLEEQYTEKSKNFLKEFQKKRAIMNYKIKLIANESERKKLEEYHFYKKFGTPEFRFVKGFAPIGVIIFKDNVLNVSTGENPMAVIITSKEIANSYKKFFYAMWGIAKK